MNLMMQISVRTFTPCEYEVKSQNISCKCRLILSAAVTLQLQQQQTCGLIREAFMLVHVWTNHELHTAHKHFCHR